MIEITLAHLIYDNSEDDIVCKQISALYNCNVTIHYYKHNTQVLSSELYAYSLSCVTVVNTSLFVFFWTNKKMT